jgi:hypothetical protein
VSGWRRPPGCTAVPTATVTNVRQRRQRNLSGQTPATLGGTQVFDRQYLVDAPCGLEVATADALTAFCWAVAALPIMQFLRQQGAV